MPEDHWDKPFTAQHHALLFASIAKECIHKIGQEDGEKILRKAVQKYGHQRGKRMALRARKNGHALTVANYFAYGEWNVPKCEMDFKLIEKNPDARLNIFRCPWYAVWKENNLLEYGKYFCKEIDTALVNGFNPALEFQVNSTQTNGEGLCDFIFKNARFTVFKMLDLVYKKKIKPGASAVMPWEYHTGHLFKTLGEVIKDELGDRADLIMETALTNFVNFSSRDHVETIKKYKNTDFDQLPQ
jgi:L-2-amino-thiazoline-4-carboxylic acid hydrolase